MQHHTSSSPREIALRHVDVARGRARHYYVAEYQSLFGELGLVISWGRIGRTPRVRLETFESENARAARWQELLAKRSAHAYS